MPLRRMRGRDRCANYNAFGHDPNGLYAYLASIFFGPDFIPATPPQVFVGRLEPPRFGPPATYQLPCLPPGFEPRAPPYSYGGIPPMPPFIDPPENFDPKEIFAALRHVARFAGRSITQIEVITYSP